MKNIDFNALAKEAYESARERGFHDGKHTDGHYFMLWCVSLLRLWRLTGKADG